MSEDSPEKSAYPGKIAHCIGFALVLNFIAIATMLESPIALLTEVGITFEIELSLRSGVSRVSGSIEFSRTASIELSARNGGSGEVSSDGNVGDE